MIQMNLETKQKHTYRLREKLMVTRGKDGGRESQGVWDGHGHTAVLSWRTSKDPLSSPGNSAECQVAAGMGGEFTGEWIHECVWLSPFADHLKLSYFSLAVPHYKIKSYKGKTYGYERPSNIALRVFLSALTTQ